jgi:predicted GIY-YIG superfamily endonuclease
MYKIYLITNLKNNKQYVGITKFSLEERFSQHIKRGFILTEAIRKYGKDYAARIERSGLKAHANTFVNDLMPETRERFKLPSNEILYIGVKE